MVLLIGFYCQINSFFDPALTDEQRFEKYEYILKEQLLIAYLSKGAITVTELNNMPIHDRKVLLNTLRQIEEDKKKKIAEMKEKRKVMGKGRHSKR